MPQTRIVTTTLAALALYATVAQPAAYANDRSTGVARPSVPDNLEVDMAFRPYLSVHADGTQNYVCLPAGTGVAWMFFGPHATLFDGDLDQVMTHDVFYCATRRLSRAAVGEADAATDRV